MIIILSPHLDDALFSMTNFIINYKGDILIVTIFTKEFDKIKFNGDYSFYANVPIRKIEDNNAINYLLKLNNNIKIKKLYLDLYDNLFRTYINNYSINSEIEKAFMNIKYNYKYEKIYCPLGIGNHIDHLITYKYATKIFNNICYYYDYPYFNLKLNLFERYNDLQIKNNIEINFNDLNEYYNEPMYKSCNFLIRFFRIGVIVFKYMFLKKKSLYNENIIKNENNTHNKLSIISQYSSQIYPIFGSFNNLFNKIKIKKEEYYIEII